MSIKGKAATFAQCAIFDFVLTLIRDFFVFCFCSLASCVNLNRWISLRFNILHESFKLIAWVTNLSIFNKHRCSMCSIVWIVGHTHPFFKRDETQIWRQVWDPHAWTTGWALSCCTSQVMLKGNQGHRRHLQIWPNKNQQKDASTI